MFDERLREEDASGVNQQADILMFRVDALHNPRHTRFAHQVSDDDLHVTLSRQRLTGLLSLLLAIAHQHDLTALFNNPSGRCQPHTAGSANH